MIALVSFAIDGSFLILSGKLIKWPISARILMRKGLLRPKLIL